LRLRLISSIAELSQETRRLFTHPARCGTVLGLSAVTIGLTILAFKLLGDGVGSHLSLGSWIMIVPPITLIQLLPISFAGWGVREVVLVVALAPFGVPPETTLVTSVLLGLCLIAIGLPGGLIWLTDWDIARPRLHPDLPRAEEFSRTLGMRKGVIPRSELSEGLRAETADTLSG
jgi:glycosyltransferase 2 family protein